MPMNRKTTLPLLIVVLALVAGSGWFIWQNTLHNRNTAEKTVNSRQLYTCTMHPQVIKDKPGACPICGMELVKKITALPDTGAPTSNAREAAAPVNVSLSPAQLVTANVATLEVKSEPLSREIAAVGIVQYDQSRQAKVTAWTAGRIDRLHVTSVGSAVSRERPVAEIYSPDLVASQQEYLMALKSRNQLRNSTLSSVVETGETVVASSRQRLRLFGLKESQIAELEKSGKPSTQVAIYSPFSGIVIEKMVQQGQYVNTGEVLFNIADLSSVWVELEVYENEFRNIRIGQQVQIRAQSLPGVSLTGRVALVYPFLDPKTRTVKARVELPNPGMKLKPEMFVNAIIRVPLADGISVPVTAVMDSGKRQLVWVEMAPGKFEPRTVVVGERIGDRLQILSGIAQGDRVVISGGYLIDSESQLNGSSTPKTNGN
ncbi:MAG: efflux RND transporter periplasmic adaptor subunit [Chlorobiaceae bacterium]|nr:efflux RND transporter periplasmic adaptor subunit [Chlorobiaceae bacterium]